MTLVLLGALLVLMGVVFMAAQPIWRGRLSRVRPLRSTELSRSTARSDTLEPQRPARGFGIQSNWPGFAMIAVGAVLLLAGAAF